MMTFSAADLSTIDRLWREAPSDHVWTGWACLSDAPEEIILYRTRAHWRKFRLRRMGAGFALYDECQGLLAQAEGLEALPDAIAAIPGLGG